jgi:hypothetical protein
MSFKDLLKPTKRKIITSLFISIIFITLFLVIKQLGYQKIFFNFNLTMQIFFVFINLLVLSLVYYPLSCGLLFFYEKSNKKTNKKGNRKAERNQKVKDKNSNLDSIFALLFILIFNPITLSLIYLGFTYFNQTFISEPCVKIIGFSESSPAKDSGIKLGEIILSVDESKIQNIDTFMHILTEKKPGDSISITTNSRNYTFNTIENPSNPRDSFIGVIIKEDYCLK